MLIKTMFDLEMFFADSGMFGNKQNLSGRPLSQVTFQSTKTGVPGQLERFRTSEHVCHDDQTILSRY